MARKNSISYPIKPQAPETLDNNPFYGIQCDEYQKKFRDAIWNPEKLIVFCNAKAGTGKTTIVKAILTLYQKFFPIFLSKPFLLSFFQRSFRWIVVCF